GHLPNHVHNTAALDAPVDPSAIIRQEAIVVLEAQPGEQGDHSLALGGADEQVDVLGIAFAAGVSGKRQAAADGETWPLFVRGFEHGAKHAPLRLGHNFRPVQGRSWYLIHTRPLDGLNPRRNFLSCKRWAGRGAGTTAPVNRKEVRE